MHCQYRRSTVLIRASDLPTPSSPDDCSHLKPGPGGMAGTERASLKNQSPGSSPEDCLGPLQEAAPLPGHQVPGSDI